MGDKVLDCMADGECGDPLYDEDDDDLSAYSIVDWNLGRVQRTRLSSQFAFKCCNLPQLLNTQKNAELHLNMHLNPRF